MTWLELEKEGQKLRDSFLFGVTQPDFLDTDDGREFIEKAKEYEKLVYESYESGKIDYETMQQSLSVLTSLGTKKINPFYYEAPFYKDPLYNTIWTSSDLGNTKEGDIVWTSERGIRANLVFYDRIEDFKDHPEWLGNNSYENVFNITDSYDELINKIKDSDVRENQNFYALQAFISIKNDLYNGKISVEEANNRALTVGQNTYIWDGNALWTGRSGLGNVYEALCGDKTIWGEDGNEAIIPQMDKYQNAANTLGYNN